MRGKRMNKDFISDMYNLDGEVAIVTGGLGRLGSQYISTLAHAGAAVVSFDIAERKNPTTEKLVSNGARFLSLPVDITKKEEVRRAVDEVVKKFGVPSILINNAGLDSPPDASVAANGPFEDVPESAWDAFLDSHLKGAFFVSQEFIRAYRTGGGQQGSIINISSTYGVVTPDQSIYDFRRKAGEVYFKPVGYSVAKSGMLNFTRWLAEYGAPFGIRVNTLVPGGVYADQNEEFVRGYNARTILGRMAHGDEYNGAVLFLASHKASSYMTGSTLVVDGGWTAR
ncbi:MAG: Oxidoreductase, short chain dehydrogenase/reductase family protein [Parcubacteria group bacterium GW2011_GWB1_50_9]|nr:MAG: Oxidoreductase, short chain dehydrogenase/reductase family protein [Parcubacteria group bacterium GW2011_GWB1_50_9]KKW24985.1 MAG: Oxidoreductase, short chain dehydrogenase/reductase family protein [candidate division Kazan bacterium GW2011_GWC1_52_13]